MNILKITKNEDGSKVYWMELPKVFFYDRYNRKEKKNEKVAYIPKNGHNIVVPENRKYIVDQKSRKKDRYYVKESGIADVYYLERIRVAKEDEGVKITYVVVNARSKNNGLMQVVRRDFYGYSYKKETKKSYQWKVGVTHYGSMANKTSFKPENFKNISYATKKWYENTSPEFSPIPEKILKSIRKDFKLKNTKMTLTPTDLPWIIKNPSRTLKGLTIEKGFYSMLKYLEDDKVKSKNYWKLLNKLQSLERKHIKNPIKGFEKERIRMLCQMASELYLNGKEIELSSKQLRDIKTVVEKICSLQNPKIDLIHLAIILLTKSERKKKEYERKMPEISRRIYYKTNRHSETIVSDYKLTDLQKVMFSHEKYFNSNYYFGK